MSKTSLFDRSFSTYSACLGWFAAMAICMAVTASPVAADDWQVLFDGTSLDGWRASRDNKQFELVGDTIRGSSSDQTHFLITTREFSDFELELEVKLHDVDLNSGVQIRTSTTRLNDKGEARPNVHGPQVDIGKSPGRSGYLYGQGNKGWITQKDDLVNHSLMKEGEWNNLRVLAVGQTIQTWINDKQVSNLVVSDDVHAKYPKGVIALQVHGVKKSPEKIRHVSFRSIRIREVPLTTLEKPAVAADRMNVLMLIADDMNSWMLDDADRYTGRVVAPNLRKLADSGVQFSRAYTASPVCSPSRTALFSGMRPWKSGHYHNGLDVKSSEPLKHALSLAGLFKNGGYWTAGYGKITHGWDPREHWDEKIGHKRDPAPPGAPLTSIGRGEQDWGAIHLDESEMNDTLNADAAIKQLQKEHDRPFFIACGTFNPHMPWYVPQKYFDMYPLEDLPTPELLADDLDDVPSLGRHLTDGKSKYVDQVIKNGLHKEAVQAYLATTTYADAQLGRVLEALESSPHRDNTIVVYFSDHGFHLGEKNHWQKATLWEEATHCMLIFRVPGLTPDGGVSERFVSLQDIYPTLAELSGLPAPDYVDGRSLKPLLKQPNAKWESTAISLLTDKDNPVQGYVSIRSDLGRYIRYGSDQEEFYDTSKDPHEWTNQIENPRYTQTIRKLRDALPAASEMVTPLPRERRKSK